MVFSGDLVLKKITSKLITFGVDGVNVIIGVIIVVIVKLKDQNAPFMIYVHCMTHVAPIW